VPPDTPRSGPRCPALIVLLACALLGGCATTPAGVSDSDPFQPLNRKIYAFNNGFDRHIMTPVANTYTRVTPRPVRSSISKFYSNLTYPDVILNDFLQGKFADGFSDAGRFLINSTVGLLGLFDPATHLGLRRHLEDTGQSLAAWGLPQGPYLMVPFAGPSTARDVPDFATLTLTNALFYVGNPYVTIPLALLGFIDYRVQAQSSIDLVNEAALDPYLFVREAYLQHRAFLIYDGYPPPRLNLDDGEDGEDDGAEAPEDGQGSPQR
jgi:phospholipid-binding lipoprotein MlaA